MSSGFIILVYDYDGNIGRKRLNTVALVVGNVVELQNNQARWLLALKQWEASGGESQRIRGGLCPSVAKPEIGVLRFAQNDKR